MIKIIGQRGSGKTKELIELARKTSNSAILTQDKKGMEVKIKNYGFNDVTVFDYEDLEQDNVPIGCKLLVHQAEPLLEYIMERFYFNKPYAITVTDSKPQGQKQKKKKEGNKSGAPTSQR